ncbi:MAG: dTMP kinase [Candidatus Liptonbacteria bacterium]|nr:dTMP kinase [Candidatus Liptonbacteria bacterium]
MENKKGKLIVFEGPDGSGQSTQAELLKKYLEEKGFQIILTKEPTRESPASQKISAILNHKTKATPEELQKLFIEDREHHVEKLILPALVESRIIICDRYFFSNFAFGAIDCALDWLISLNQNFPIPDLTLILDVSPEVCLERITSRGRPVQFFENLEKLGKVMENYKKVAPMFSNVYLVNGERPIETIHQEILEIVKKVLE